jgi:general secretion pathway protein E
LTFATGLRHILRQDPDVILVGETRDLETAEIAMRAALTGHLVFTTLHTNDAAGAVIRFVDMGVEPYLLASCLRGVLAQRLVRRLCGECREKEAGDRGQEAGGRGEHGVPLSPDACPLTPVWSPVGCPACLEGYSGRTGLFELLVLDADMQAAVRAGHAGAGELRALAERRGMPTLLSDGISKALAGLTSLSELHENLRVQGI